jgi:predicted DNA-binding transcriptional regulator YafY
MYFTQVFCVILQSIVILILNFNPMPVDLKKFQRIFLIHQKLRTKLHYDWEELADACESKLDVKVSQRTIEYDIAALKNTFFAPVKKRKGKYFYDDIPYSIFEVFDNSEYGSLNELLALLRQQKAKKWDVLDEFLLRIEQRIGVLGGEESQIISFEQMPLKGLENLDKLHRSIKENRILQINYEPFGSSPYPRIIKPVFLKQYNSRWFLFGWEKGKEPIQNLPLDRICSFKFWHEDNFSVKEFNPTTYFSNIIGVTLLDKSIENIVFKVSKNRAYYLETKLIHSSQQKIEEDEASMVFTISVIPNNEMWGKLMEYSEDLVILEPEYVKKEMEKRIKKL